MPKGGKAVLIVLSVLVALGLFFLVTAFACNFYCNGAGAAGLLVWLAGTGLIIFLLVIAIRAIVGRKKNPKQLKPDPVEPIKTD